MSESKSLAASLKFPLLIVAAIAAGGALGWISPTTGHALAPFGRLYLSLLLMCIIPLLFTAIISSLGAMVARHSLGRNLFLIAAVFVVGLVVAAAIGTTIGWVTGVGEGLQESRALGNLLLRAESTGGGEALGDLTAGGGEERYADLFGGRPADDPGRHALRSVAPSPDDLPGFVDYLQQLVPQNVASAVIEENYLAILFFSVLMGVALGFAPAEARGTALRVLEAFFDALLRIIGWIIFLLPAGLVAIVAGEVARGGLDFVPSLGKLVLVSVATTAVAMLLFGATIWAARGGSLWGIFRSLREPLLVALATSSSLASIPSAMVALKRELGLAEENVKLLLPLGVMMNPIGSALFFSLSAIFAVQLHAQSLGSLGAGNLALIVVGAVLAGLAAMGLPGPSSVWMLGIVLEPIGVPPEVGIIALMAVMPIIDPLFTMVNVMGNCTATAILDRRLSAAAAAPPTAAAEPAAVPEG